MRYRCCALVLLLTAGSAANAAAQKQTAPIKVSFDSIPELKSGEEGSTTIRLEAERALDRLEVTLRGEGIEVLSERKFAYTRLEAGALRDLPVKLRLTNPERGFLFVAVTARYDGFTRTRNSSLPIGSPRPIVTRAAIGLEEDLSTLTFMNGAGGTAVVRFGRKPFEVISVGDRLGKNKAEVKAIEAGKLVLEETFIGADGKPNKAEIVIKKGETGGTRYLLRPEKKN